MWLKKHDSISALVELFPAVIASLEIISEWSHKETSSLAYQLLQALREPQFIVSLFTLHKLFRLSVILCKTLQKENIDLVEAVNLAEDTAAEMKALRVNAEKTFAEIFADVTKCTETHEIEIRVPRITSAQRHRCNVPSNSPESYYRNAVFIPFLDGFIQHLEARFIAHRNILRGFQCLLPTDPSQPPSTDHLKGFHVLTEFYSADMSGSTDNRTCEINLWYRRLCRLQKTDLPKNALEGISACHAEILPNIYTLLLILATLPVSTCSCERSFSSLRRLKNYLRNTTAETRMNGLALLYIHRDLTPSVTDVLNKLSLKSRRLNLRLIWLEYEWT